MSIFKVLLFFSFLLLLNISVSLACTCGREKPCEALAQANAVFLGIASKTKYVSETITAPSNATSTTFTLSRPVTKFKIDKTFTGTSEKEIEISGSGTTCDFYFKEGGKYLIFANFGDDGKTLFTSICSGTSLLSEAKQTLAYLQKAERNQIGATFEGEVNQLFFNRQKNSWDNRPLVNSKIILESENAKFQIFTNKKGKFTLNGIPKGNYKVRTHPKVNSSRLGFVNYGEIEEPRNEWEVEMPRQGCVNTWFTARPVGEISGRVTGKLDENPWIKIVFADLKETDKNGLPSARIDKDGSFKFTFLPQGKFYIGFNLNSGPFRNYPYPEYFYPGVANRKKAILISLKEGGKISNLTFEFPSPVTERTIIGVAVWKDGKPAVNVPIELYNIQTDWREGGPVWTDGEGRFSIIGMEGQTYKLSASIKKGTPLVNSKPIIVKVEKENKPVKLVVELP